MALKAGRVGVHPDEVDLNGHLKQTADLSLYFKKSDAPGYSDILTQTDASTTYLSLSSASSNYQEKLVSGTNIKTINNESLLGSGNITIQGGGGGDLSAYVQKTEAPGYSDILTQTTASSTYQTQSGMSSYVLKSEATGYNDILTSTSAASTYLTQSSASSTYQTQSGMSSYVLKSEATGYNDILTNASASTLYQPILVSGTNIRTVNGKSLVASGNINTYYGIDTANVIASPTASYDFSYTATEDCWICGYHEATYANLVTIKIDGVTVTQYLNTHSTGDATKWGGIYFLKANQVFRSYVGDSRRGDGYYTVYGVKR